MSSRLTSFAPFLMTVAASSNSTSMTTMSDQVYPGQRRFNSYDSSIESSSSGNESRFAVSSSTLADYFDSSVGYSGPNVSTPLRAFNYGNRLANSGFDDHLANLTTGFQNISFDAKSTRRCIKPRSLNYYKRFGVSCIKLPKKVVFDKENVEQLKRSRLNKKKVECAFCKNIPEVVSRPDYKPHMIKNSKNVVTCPLLRDYVCPLCNNPGGDNAHTMRYCPKKREQLNIKFMLNRNISQ